MQIIFNLDLNTFTHDSTSMPSWYVQNVLHSDDQEVDYNEMNFPSNLIVTDKSMWHGHYFPCPFWIVTQCYIFYHYGDVIMGTIASQITSLTDVYSTVYSDADQRKHQSSASLTIVWGIHRGPVNSPNKWPVTRKMFPFDDVIMTLDYPS